MIIPHRLYLLCEVHLKWSWPSRWFEVLGRCAKQESFIWIGADSGVLTVAVWRNAQIRNWDVHLFQSNLTARWAESKNAISISEKWWRQYDIVVSFLQSQSELLAESRRSQAAPVWGIRLEVHKQTNACRIFGWRTSIETCDLKGSSKSLNVSVKI